MNENEKCDKVDTSSQSSLQEQFIYTLVSAYIFSITDSSKITLLLLRLII